MAPQLTIARLEEMREQPVYDRNGEKIGKVEEIFYDASTDQPEWVGLGTGFFGTKRVLVPVAGASATDDGLTVPYDKEQIKNSPDIDSDEISGQTEQSLHEYYGLGSSGTNLPRADSAFERDSGATDEAVTRSEEELRVGKREVEAGGVRLRKWVETEPVEAEVELRQETAHVVREPLNEPVGDDAIGEEEIEVPLRGEQAVVQKEVVAKERVGLEKDVQADRQRVTDEVRKEHVEVENQPDQ